MTMFFFLPLLVLNVLAQGLPVHAFEPLTRENKSSEPKPPDLENAPEARFVEPIVTEETIPTEKGELDLRLSMEYGKKGREISATAPRLQLFYGVIERLSMEVNLPFEYRKNEARAYELGDVSTSLKWLAVEHSLRVPAVVLGIETGFPTGDRERETGEDVFEITPFVAFLKQVSAFTIQGNLGWSKEFGVHSAAAMDSFVYNWAVAYPVSRRNLHVLAEILGRVPLDEGESQIAIAPGIKYNLNDKQFVALAVPIGLNRETSPWRVIVQFQFGF